MKSIYFLLIALLGTQCLAMDVNQFSIDKTKRILMNNIILGSIENINFSAIPKNLLDNALYVACYQKKYDIAKQLIMHQADTQSLYAQLARLHAEIAKDFTVIEILNETILPSLSKGLFWAVSLQQTDLIVKIVEVLRTQPKILQGEMVKLALIYADFLNADDIVDYLNQYIAIPSETDALLLAAKHDLPDVVCELLSKSNFEIKILIDAMEIAINRGFINAANIIFQHLINHNLIEGALEIICEHDSDKSMHALLTMTEHKLRLAVTGQLVATKMGANNVLLTINKFIADNQLKAEHPRLIAVRK